MPRDFLSLAMLKYVICLCNGFDRCCIFCLFCQAWSCKCSYRCCEFVSCVNTVAVLNTAFCMACSMLMLVDDAKGDHM